MDAIYDIAPFVRRPTAVVFDVERLPEEARPKRPSPSHKRVWASMKAEADWSSGVDAMCSDARRLASGREGVMARRFFCLVNVVCAAIVTACEATVVTGLDSQQPSADAGRGGALGDAGSEDVSATRHPVCDQPAVTVRDGGAGQSSYSRLAAHSQGCVDYQAHFRLILSVSPPAFSGGLYVCNRCAESRFLDWIPVEDENTRLALGGAPPQRGYTIKHGVFNAGPWASMEWVDSAGRALPEFNCLTRGQTSVTASVSPVRLELEPGELMYIQMVGPFLSEDRNSGFALGGAFYSTDLPFWDRAPNLLDPGLALRLTYPILRDASQTPRPEFAHQVRCEQAGLPFASFRLQEQYPWSLDDWPTSLHPLDFFTAEDRAAGAAALERELRLRR